jgi:hypothetical protein
MDQLDFDTDIPDPSKSRFQLERKKRNTLSSIWGDIREIASDIAFSKRVPNSGWFGKSALMKPPVACNGCKSSNTALHSCGKENL